MKPKTMLLGLGLVAVAAVALTRKKTRRLMDPTDPCFPSSKYRAVHDSGSRPLSDIRVIVIHSTEGSSAESTAAYFHNPASGGSTQLVVGEDGAFRCLPDDVEPWAAPGTNSDGLHIELAGFAGFTAAQWLARQKTLTCAARLIAQWCFDYDIPATFLDADALKAGDRGITTHWQVTQAYSGGKGHYDPGQGFPIETFMSMIAAELAKLPYT